MDLITTTGAVGYFNTVYHYTPFVSRDNLEEQVDLPAKR